MPVLTVELEDRIRYKRMQIGLADDQPVGDVIEALLEQFELPRQTFDQRPIDYRLVRARGGRRLKEDATLIEAGIGEGERLRLVARRKARRVWRAVRRLLKEIEDELIDEVTDQIRDEIVERAWERITRKLAEVEKTRTGGDRVERVRELVRQAGGLSRLFEVTELAGTAGPALSGGGLLAVVGVLAVAALLGVGAVAALLARPRPPGELLLSGPTETEMEGVETVVLQPTDPPLPTPTSTATQTNMPSPTPTDTPTATHTLTLTPTATVATQPPGDPPVVDSLVIDPADQVGYGANCPGWVTTVTAYFEPKGSAIVSAVAHFRYASESASEDVQGAQAMENVDDYTTQTDIVHDDAAIAAALAKSGGIFEVWVTATNADGLSVTSGSVTTDLVYCSIE
ncbi:MAG: EsaB/YukD family protein [Chloroflexota bacterium]